MVGQNNGLEGFNQIYRVTPCINKLICSPELYNTSFKKCVKIGKACGPDGVKPDHLKLIGPQNCGLYNVVKSCLDNLKMPINWKTGKVTCAFKKGCKQDPNNYRPLTLLSVPSKIVENFVCTQIDAHLKSLNLVSDQQWGFRKVRSTEGVLLKT